MLSQSRPFSVNIPKWIEKWTVFLVSLAVFIIPIEHKYDKPLRNFSRTLIPNGLVLPPEFNKKIYFYATDIIALILFICLLFTFKIPLKKIFLEKKTAFLWVIFFCSLISILNSPLSHYATVYTRLIQLLTPIFLFSFLTQYPSSEKLVKRLFYILVAAALIQSTIAITQYFTQNSLGLHLLSESRDAPATFHIASGKRWIFDYFFPSQTSYTTLKRSAGTLPHCNVLGGFLILSILASYSLIASEKKRLIKYLLALALLIQFIGLSTTYSRSAIFGIALATLVWFSIALLQRNLRSYLFLAKIIVLSVGICACLFCEQYAYRGGIINYNNAAKQSDQTRINAQHTALKMIKDHPLSGVGFQQFTSIARTYGNPTGTHNIYLFIWSEMGFIALLAFLGFIVTVLMTTYQAPFTPQLASLLSIFIAFLFIGFCDFYPFLFQQGKLMLFISSALLVSEAARLKQLKIKRTCVSKEV